MKLEELKEWLESTIINCKQLLDVGYHKVEKEIPFYEECLKMVNYKMRILDYVSDKVIEKHKTCLTDKFDNGYFWAMKELQEFILKGCIDDNK